MYSEKAGDRDPIGISAAPTGTTTPLTELPTRVI